MKIAGNFAGLVASTVLLAISFAHAPALAQAPKSGDGTGCAEKISNSICWVTEADATKNFEETTHVPTCLPGGAAKFREPLLRAVKTLPTVFKKMACAMDTFYISEGMRTSAYAEMADSANRITIRRDLLDGNVSNSEFETWKQQLIFNKSTPRYKFDPNLPRFQATGPELQNSALISILLHELSHILDRRNRVNAGTCGNSKCETYVWSRDSWAFREWQPLDQRSEWQPKATAGTWLTIPYRGMVDFYFSKDVLEPDFVVDIYKSLQRSSFITQYATLNAFEDFAETATYYFFSAHYQQKTQIIYGNKVIFDFEDQLRSPFSKWKIEYIQKFFAREDLKFRPE